MPEAVINITMGQGDNCPLNTISAGPPIEYQEVRVKVLDCRSGEPVANAHVKTIVAYVGSNEVSITFKRTHERIDSSQSTIMQAQIALNRLGYNHGNAAEAFGTNGRASYNSYWNDRVPPGTVEEVTSGNPPDEYLELITEEYNSHWGTDDEGVLTLRIPKAGLSGNSLYMYVGFWDFPVVLEELEEDDRDNPYCRPNANSSGATGCNIKWTGNQSTDWNGCFGWEMKKDDKKSEFRVSAELKIKVNSDEFEELDNDLLSKFYDDGDEDSPHFVLFAMQWCQPVWDGIADPSNPSAGDVNTNSYVQDENYHGLNMHIVTRHTTNGKVYGTTRHGTNRPEAIDIFTVVKSSPLFAVHGGKVGKYNNPLSDAGRYVIVKWNNRQIRYLHMHEISVDNNENVQCGTILGIAGRTGNFSPESERTAAVEYQPPSPYPDHVHMDDGYGNHGNGILSHIDEIDESNRKCIPTYSFPLLLPCRCNVSQTYTDIDECNHANATYTGTCWVSQESKCPYASE